MRNQHQLLLRRLFRISQTSTVEEYVQSFSDLVDQISAYDPHPDTLRNLTRFLDGLKPAVRVLVAIQQPANLDAAFTLALLYEELGDGLNPLKRAQPLTLPPPPPARWVSKTVEEKKQYESARGNVDDKWSNLKAYRRAKGLCFVCGEKWGKEHVCNGSAQLHIVQEMINYMQAEELDTGQEEDSETEQQHLMLLSAAAVNTNNNSQKTLQLRVTVQGQAMLFLVDSGSSTCFIDQSRAHLFSGKT